MHPFRSSAFIISGKKSDVVALCAWRRFNITSEEVAWFIRGLDYDLISFGFGESKTAGGGKTPPKAKHQKRSRKTVPERPKLMDPIPEPEQEPETETQGGKQSYSAIPTDEEMALFEKLQSYGL